MDIHTDVDFDLFFEQSNKVIKPIVYFQDELLLNEENYIELVENKNLNVTFTSEDKSAKFFFEGLDSLPERDVETVEGVPYLTASSISIPIIKNDYYPLIPGKYIVKVESNFKFFFTLIKIIPNQISDDQWIIMKDEVEKHLTGLAKDLVKRKLNINSKETLEIPLSQIIKYLIIKKHYKSVAPALIDLNTKANYRIKKTYEMVPVERAKVVDEKSYIHRLRFPELNTVIKSPTNTFHFDLPENRWLKKIVKLVITFLIEFNNTVLNSIEITNKEIQALELYARFQESTKNIIKEKEEVLNYLLSTQKGVSKIKSTFQLIQSSTWYEEVNEIEEVQVPHVMNLDSRYRSIYQLHRALKQEEPELKIDPMFNLQWKRTDKLYEIWGFIQVLKIIENQLGFEPLQGWIYSSKVLEESIIPILESNTTIEYKKGNVLLKLIYDGVIPRIAPETSMENNPVYATLSNNMPDLRIDVYKENIYSGSLIIDFKYRAKGSIWNNSLINTSYKNTTMSQLLNYANSCRSYFLYGGKSKTVTRHINPIHEVWAIHPKQTERVNYINSYDDYNLKLVQMSPDHDQNQITELLKLKIADILKNMEEFSR